MEGYRAYGFMIFTVMHPAEALFFSHPMPIGIRYWFHFFFYTLYHYAYGSLRFVKVKVPWIMEDHGSVLECWRLVLSAAFVSLEFI